VQRLLYLS